MEIAMSVIKEFREFALQGSVLDLAVGVVIGGVFNPIVKSFVDDILMPPLGLLMGGVDFTNLYFLLKSGAQASPPYASLEAAKAAGAVTINYGTFINLLLTFIITAFAIFLVVKLANRWRKAPAAEADAKPA
jgi:large conductance mechanosensitive channel